jgi:hypothetical protein
MNIVGKTLSGGVLVEFSEEDFVRLRGELDGWFSDLDNKRRYKEFYNTPMYSTIKDMNKRWITALKVAYTIGGIDGTEEELQELVDGDIYVRGLGSGFRSDLWSKGYRRSNG